MTEILIAAGAAAAVCGIVALLLGLFLGIVISAYKLCDGLLHAVAGDVRELLYGAVQLLNQKGARSVQKLYILGALGHDFLPSFCLGFALDIFTLFCPFFFSCPLLQCGS